jgi:hypothetical protein
MGGRATKAERSSAPWSTWRRSRCGGERERARADIFLGVVAYEVPRGEPLRGDARLVFKILQTIRRGRLDPRITGDRRIVQALGRDGAIRFCRSPTAESGRDPPCLLPGARKGHRHQPNRPMPPGRRSSRDPNGPRRRGRPPGRVYQRGVAAFNAGGRGMRREDEPVLDEVPVQAMSLHYLAMSEERRRERLSERSAGSDGFSPRCATPIERRGGGGHQPISSWHRQGISRGQVVPTQRRGAPSAVSVGSARRARGRGRPVAGTLSREGEELRYVPAKGSRFHPEQKRQVEVESPLAASRESSRGKGIWILVGTGVLFLGLVTMWLSSIGSPKPSVKAAPTTLPGVRTSPFEGIDADGTVVLQVTRPPSFVVAGHPHVILAGSPKGRLFGELDTRRRSRPGRFHPFLRSERGSPGN